MYKTLTGIIVAFTLSLFITSTAFADSWGCGEGLKSMISSLKLDDAQKSKIKPIMEHLKSNVKDSVNQMSAIESQIKEQTVSANMDQSAVNNLVDQKTKLIGDLMKAKITATNQILVILTPAQKTQIQSMMKKLEEKIAAKMKSCHDND